MKTDDITDTLQLASIASACDQARVVHKRGCSATMGLATSPASWRKCPRRAGYGACLWRPPKLIGRCTGADVLHSVPYGIVEQDCDLARRGDDRLGLADARREPPVEGADWCYGSKPQQCRSAPPERRVPTSSILPSEILLLGARPSHEVKCFALGQEAEVVLAFSDQLEGRGKNQGRRSCYVLSEQREQRRARRKARAFG